MTKVTKLKLYEGNQDIEKAIQSVKTRGKAFDNLVHAVALSVINHIEQHGDIRHSNMLVEAMPKSSRKNALIEWFETFGKLSYDQESKVLTYAKEKKTYLTDATNQPFWDFQKEPEYKPFDLELQLAKLLDRAVKKAENPHEEDNISTALLEQLVKLAPSKKVA